MALHILHAQKVTESLEPACGAKEIRAVERAFLGDQRIKPAGIHRPAKTRPGGLRDTIKAAHVAIHPLDFDFFRAEGHVRFQEPRFRKMVGIFPRGVRIRDLIITIADHRIGAFSLIPVITAPRGIVDVVGSITRDHRSLEFHVVVESEFLHVEIHEGMEIGRPVQPADFRGVFGSRIRIGIGSIEGRIFLF